MWKVGSSNPSRVKRVTCEIDTYRYLAWLSALIAYVKDWLAEYQDNVIVWDMGSCCLRDIYIYISRLLVNRMTKVASGRENIYILWQEYDNSPLKV